MGGGLFQVNKVLRLVCSRNTLYKDWDAAQLAESLPRMHEALGLIPSTM